MSDHHRIAVTSLVTPVGRLQLAAVRRGLVRVAFADAPAGARLDDWLDHHLPGSSIDGGGSPVTHKAALQIGAYFTGTRTDFDVPLCMIGSPLQYEVWIQALELAYATSVSTDQLAEGMRGRNSAAAVAAAADANPMPILIPTHRIEQRTVTAAAGDSCEIRLAQWLRDHEASRRHNVFARYSTDNATRRGPAHSVNWNPRPRSVTRFA